MSRTLRPVVLAVALLACAGALAAQAPPAQTQKPTPAPATQKPGQQPTFRAGISFVRVDVIVNDRQGNPVDDLRAADFEVSEDGKPQKIETFKLIKIDTAVRQQVGAAQPPREIRNQFDEEAEAAREDVRIFAIFLDDYHVRRSSAMVVRARLQRFLETQLGPNDLVEIAYPLTPVSGLLLSRDHAATARAVGQFEGRKYDYRPRTIAEEQYVRYPASVVEAIRNEVSLSALRALVSHLGGVREGRKSLILVSEGYSNLLPPQLSDPVAGLPGLGNPARGNPAYPDTMNDSQKFFASTDMQSDLRRVYDEANRANTAIYALDPRGLATNEFDINEGVGPQTDRETLQSTQDTLHVLADNTDGKALMNSNDVTDGLKQVLRDSSAYYLVGYSSTQPPSDGRFHEIKVRTKRSGVSVRARKGYWAPTEDERAHSLAPPKPQPPAEVTRALGNIAEPWRGRVIRTWVGTSRGDNGRTRVTFVWEPIPPPPGTTAEDRPVGVWLTGVGAKGEPYFRGRVPEEGAATPPGSVASAAQPPSRVVFDVPPGKLQLKLSVEGMRTKAMDSDTRDVDVPDLTEPKVALSTPVVYRARTVREFRALVADAASVPTPDRQFSRTERLLVRVEAYGPAGAPAVTARLLNRAGTEMSAMPPQPDPASPGRYTFDLPLAPLAAGEYLIEITAKGDGGEATQLIAIRVTA
jgi:VWFA-related protein